MNQHPIPTTIVTVGTALINNLKRHDDLKQFVETPEVLDTSLKSKEKINFIVTALGNLEPSEKLLGPEINSTYSLLEKGKITNENMYLIVSDTPEGEFEGKILKKYFENKNWKYPFNKVEIKKIEGLQSEDEYRFKNRGLRNLVATMAEIIWKHNKVVINATGGYKAEIAYATVIGQSFEKPVYYQFEDFKGVIELPPQPVSLDFEFFLKAKVFLEKLDKDSVEAKEYEEYRKALGTDARILDGLVEWIGERGEKYYALSPMGKLFYEKCKYWWNKQNIKLPEEVPEEKKKKPVITDPTAKRVEGFEMFLKKLVKEVEYVKEVHSKYANPDLPGVSHFRLEGDEVVLIYSDGSRTAKAVIYTLAQDIEQKRKVVEDLNNRFFA